MQLQDLSNQISPGKKGEKNSEQSRAVQEIKTHSAMPRYFTEDLIYWYNNKYQCSSVCKYVGLSGWLLQNIPDSFPYFLLSYSRTQLNCASKCAAINIWFLFLIQMLIYSLNALNLRPSVRWIYQVSDQYLMSHWRTCARDPTFPRGALES